jgi:ArsR family transcriptional regulator, arsenate/arsenite/antimonite-responsive transcriptional repressor
MMNEPILDTEIIPDESLACLKAYADPNRLRIFHLLLQGESCNAYLNEALGLSPNLLSHHLRVLREAGLICDRRDSVDARWIYYRVDEEGLNRWYRWLATFFDPAQLERQREVCGPEHQQRQEASLIAPLVDELEVAPAFQEQIS